MAGYRDLLLNISIENEHTKLLGTNHHICEVQLTLDVFHVSSFFFGGGRGLRVVVLTETPTKLNGSTVRQDCMRFQMQCVLQRVAVC